MTSDNECTDDFCSLPTASSYDIVGAKKAGAPSAPEEFRHYCYERFYQSDVTAAVLKDEANAKFNTDYSLSLLLKIRCEMTLNGWWPNDNNPQGWKQC